MNKFLLFAGDRYYPEGGWKDFKGSFPLVTEAMNVVVGNNFDWWQIVDSETREVADAGESDRFNHRRDPHMEQDDG